MFGGKKDDIKVIGICHGEKMYEMNIPDGITPVVRRQETAFDRKR